MAFECCFSVLLECFHKVLLLKKGGRQKGTLKVPKEETLKFARHSFFFQGVFFSRLLGFPIKEV